MDVEQPPSFSGKVSSPTQATSPVLDVRKEEKSEKKKILAAMSRQAMMFLFVFSKSRKLSPCSQIRNNCDILDFQI